MKTHEHRLKRLENADNSGLVLLNDTADPEDARDVVRRESPAKSGRRCNARIAKPEEIR